MRSVWFMNVRCGLLELSYFYHPCVLAGTEPRKPASKVLWIWRGPPRCSSKSRAWTQGGVLV